MVGWKLVGETQRSYMIFTQNACKGPYADFLKGGVTITVNVYFPTPFVYLLMYSGKKLAVFNL